MSAPGQDVRAFGDATVPGAQTPLRGWLNWLEAGRGEHIDLGLERCRIVAARLGLGQPAATVVTVAGTNGKGSSVALLEAIWIRSGYRVGTYTSPHLIRYNERIRVNGVPIEEPSICRAFAAVETARGDVPLTYFEFATLAGLHLFQDAALDIVVLEVGLGGRLDAVNIIEADVALIAAIGLDHEDWLGETRDQIGREKAGIMRAGKPVVCSDHAVPPSIPQVAATLGAQLWLLGVDYAFEAEDEHWTWWCGDRVLAQLPLPALSGSHQMRNAAGVLQVVNLLQERHPVDASEIAGALTEVVLFGRFHRRRGRCEYVMDVAHNPQAAEIFTATLRTLPPVARTHALIGMLKTKNHREFFRPLSGLVDTWHFADLPGINGARAVDLEQALLGLDRHARVTCYGDVEQAHRGVLADADVDDRILVIGSFMTVGTMMQLFDTQAVSST